MLQWAKRASYLFGKVHKPQNNAIYIQNKI